MQQKVGTAQKTNDKPAYLSAATVADDLNLSRRSIRRLCECGELPAIKIGHQWRILAKPYLRYIEALKDDAIDQFLLTIAAKK